MRALVLACFLVASSYVSGQAPDRAEFLSSCAGCHGIPDARIAGDDLWIGRIASTACVQPSGPKSAELRTGLMALLRSATWERPARQTSTRVPGEGEGAVRIGFGDASVLLVPVSDGVGQPVRLVWPSHEPSGGTRALRAGRYRIQSYRLGLMDDRGIRWELWGSGAKGREVLVEPGQTIDLGIERKVRLAANARTREGDLLVSVQVLGDGKLGATIVRGKERVPAKYRAHHDDRVVASGDLAYG